MLISMELEKSVGAKNKQLVFRALLLTFVTWSLQL
jgi:hypothetical protein